MKKYNHTTKDLQTRLRAFLAASLAVCGVVAAVPSCIKAEASVEVPELSVVTGGVSFDIQEEEMGIMTRSRLTASDIETKKTDVTLAAYRNGTLYAKQYFTSGLSAMTLSMEAGTYNVYALVNMGDMTSSFPNSESNVGNITYSIPSYDSGSTSVATRGMPMAGFVSQKSITSSTTGTQNIPVKRLLSKVNVNLTCHWTGAVITSAKVYNMNKVLRPFGGAVTVGSSAASSASDILSFQEIHGTGTGTQSTMSAVFYVPENMQGTISGISSSTYKNPDLNSTVNSNLTKLTYLQVAVTSTGTYSGSVTYRSLLGNNATTNFDIQRNYEYNWTINYYESGLQYDDWKRDTDITDNRTLVLRSPIYAEPGESVPWINSGNSALTVITSNIAFEGLDYSFTGGNTSQVINSATSGHPTTSGSFTIKTTASQGQTSTLTVQPSSNPTSALTKTSEVRVVNKVVEWVDYDATVYSQENRKVYTVNPGSTVDAPVDFYYRWSGSVAGHERGQFGTKWNYTATPVSGITSTAVDGTSGNTNDRIRYSVANTVAPGDYAVTVSRISPGSGSDQAYVRVNDTRYLRWADRSSTLGSDTHIYSYTYTQPEIHTTIIAGSNYAASGYGWTATTTPAHYNFGDITGERKLQNTTVTSSNWSTYLGMEFSTNGTTWSGTSSNFSVGTRSFSASDQYVTFTNSRALPAGDYAFRIRFADGTQPVVAWLHVIEDAITSYDNPVLTLSYSGTPIAYNGGTATPTLTYTQTVHYLSGATSQLSGTVTSGATYSPSNASSGMSANAGTGVVTAASNEGSTTTTYGTPEVTSFSYSPNPVAVGGGTATPTVAYRQTRSSVRGTTQQRSITMSATATVNGKSATSNSVVVPQSGDQGATTPMSDLTSGGTLAFTMNAATGFTLNGSNGNVTVASNTGSTSIVYGTPAITSFTYSPNPISASGGDSTPTVAYSQSRTEVRSATSQRSTTAHVVVTMNGLSSQMANATITQSADAGASTALSNLTTGGSVTYSMDAATGFSLLSTSTGDIRAAVNSGAARSTTAHATVTMNSQTSTAANCVVNQSATAVTYSLAIDPQNLMLANGYTAQFHAILSASNSGTTTDVTTSSTWTISTNGTQWVTSNSLAEVVANAYGQIRANNNNLQGVIYVRAQYIQNGQTYTATTQLTIVSPSTPGWDFGWDELPTIIL